MAERKKATVKRKVKPTDEEIFLGIEPKTEAVEVVDYENANILYKVTNLKVAASTPSVFSGAAIETFIGCQNADARNKLINGAKEVITLDGAGNQEYKIEVID